jgi:hypothetical protein
VQLKDGREVPDFFGPHIHRALFIEPDENDSSHQLTAGKARIMLHEGTVRGHAITDRQRRFFGAVASGEKIRKRGSR